MDLGSEVNRHQRQNDHGFTLRCGLFEGIAGWSLFIFSGSEVDQGEQWYFRPMESITIRLDKIGTLPASKFPDVTEDQKVWIREERRMQAQTDLFNLLAKEKGKDYAFNWFRDGAGYFMEAN